MREDKDPHFMARRDAEERWLRNQDNPFNWSPCMKLIVMATASFLTFTSGINATCITTVGSKLAEIFDVDNDVFPNAYWPVTSWAMGAAVGPMIGMPLLENFGTRRGYIVAYVGFTLFLIPQAVAQNFATLIVTRLFAGIFGGVLQNGSEAVLADLYKTDEERSFPVTFFILVYEAGLTLGPTYAAIFSADQWRWIFYTHLIAYGAFFPFFLVAMRETRGPVVLAAKANQTKREHSDKEIGRPPGCNDDADFSQLATRPPLMNLFYEAVVRPTVMLFTEPVTFVFTLWSAFCIGLVYISTESIDVVYRGHFGFSERQVGLVQAAIFVGEVVGFLFCLPQNALFRRSARWNTENPGTPSPESRLILSIPASFIGLAGGLLLYAWTSSMLVKCPASNSNWVIPSIGLALVGFGIMTVVTSVCLYVTDAYTSLAGSCIAAVALGENLFAAWLPLSTPRMYQALGPQWASSLLGFVGLALSFAPVALMVFGSRIRARSKFMTSG